MSDDGGDSDVVADTYGVSAGQSRFSAGRNKRQKVDDAPTSASTLSEEQARVRDLVLAGKNVRTPTCVCVQALGRACGGDVRAQHSHRFSSLAAQASASLGSSRTSSACCESATGRCVRLRASTRLASCRPPPEGAAGWQAALALARRACVSLHARLPQLLSRLRRLCRSLAQRWP